MARKIKLTLGKIAVIDDEDFETVSKFFWHYAHGYARTGGDKKTYMHRMIMGAIKGVQIDHINGDKLDNRKQNLRLCGVSENNVNRGPRTQNRKKTSQYKGVSYLKSRNKWVAQISWKKKQKRIGHFDTEREAAEAYNSEAVLLHGDFARINTIK